MVRWQLIGIALFFIVLAGLIFMLNQRRINFITWAFSLPLLFGSIFFFLLAVGNTKEMLPILMTMTAIFLPVLLVGLGYFAIRDWRAPMQHVDRIMAAQGWHRVARARYHYLLQNPRQNYRLAMSIALDRVYGKHRVLIHVDDVAGGDFYIGHHSPLPVPTRASTHAMATPVALEPLILQAAQPQAFQTMLNDEDTQALYRSLLCAHATTFSELYLFNGRLHWLGRGFLLHEENIQHLRDNLAALLLVLEQAIP